MECINSKVVSFGGKAPSGLGNLAAEQSTRHQPQRPRGSEMGRGEGLAKEMALFNGQQIGGFSVKLLGIPKQSYSEIWCVVGLNPRRDTGLNTDGTSCDLKKNNPNILTVESSSKKPWVSLLFRFSRIWSNLFWGSIGRSLYFGNLRRFQFLRERLEWISTWSGGGCIFLNNIFVSTLGHDSILISA